MPEFNGDSYTPYRDGNPIRIKLEDIDRYTLDDFGLNVQGIKDNIFGISIVDPATGRALPDRYYEQSLKSAVAWVEKKFDIKILPRKVVEEKDYYQTNYNNYNYMKMRQRPVLQVEEFSMRLNGQTSQEYPSNWWKVNALAGQIQLMPALGLQMQDLITLNTGGVFNPAINAPLYGMPITNNSTYAPQVFRLGYIAGMLPPAREGVEEDWEMPEDLKFLILKQAAKDALQIWARVVLDPGIAAQSFSMDGISENKITTASATYGAARADIVQLDEDIKQLSAGLDAKYGIRLGIIS